MPIQKSSSPRSNRVLRSQSNKIGHSKDESKKEPELISETSQSKIPKKRKKESENDKDITISSKPSKIRKKSIKNEEEKFIKEGNAFKEFTDNSSIGLDCVTAISSAEPEILAVESSTSKIESTSSTEEQSHNGEHLDEEEPQDSLEIDTSEHTEKVDNRLELVNQLVPQLFSLRNDLAAMLAKIPQIDKKKSWGTLLSNDPQLHPNVALLGGSFSVGRNKRCNLVLKDAHIPNLLFKLHYLSGIVVLESAVTSNLLSVNNRIYKRGSRVILKHGDQINIAGSSPYLFTYCSSMNGATERDIDRNGDKKSENGENSSIEPLTPTATFLSLPSLPKHKSSTTENSPSNIPYMTRSQRKRSVASGNNHEEQKPSNSTNLSSPIESEDSLNISTPIQSQELQELKKQFNQEFLQQLINPNDITYTFDNLPFQLSSGTKEMLVSSAYIYLVKPEFVRYVEQLPQSRKILLCGPAGSELYQERVVCALAKQLNAHLLIIDSSSFDYEPSGSKSSTYKSNKENKDSKEKGEENWEEPASKFPKEKERSKNKRGGTSNSHNPLSRLLRHSLASNSKLSPSEYKGKVMITFDEASRKVFSDVFGQGTNAFIIDQSDTDTHQTIQYDLLRIEGLFGAITGSGHPVILFVKEAEATLLNTYERYSAFKKQLANINGPIVIIASTIGSLPEKSSLSGLFKSSHHSPLFDLAFLDHLSHRPPEERPKDPQTKIPKLLLKLFANRINIAPPQDDEQLSVWNKLISGDNEQLKKSKNMRNITKVLNRNNLECEPLSCPDLTKELYPMENVEKIVAWALSNHLMNTPESRLALVSNTPDKKLQISQQAFQYAIDILKKIDISDPNKKNLRDVECENEFERKLLSEVIPPSEIDIKFEDIGALDEVKQTIKELVMLPLQRPELFSKGALTKPCKGILLFGPPGTGKTMLAKAVASQSGANFINISMSTIASKWFGEGEKYVKAVFTLASKISPTVIFIDEVDSILGKRERPGEHEAMRKIKNEFMTNWDGLKTKDKERVLVLAATNRPFDLDDAVLRRLSRRLLVDLPNQENRVKILKIILQKEDLVDNFNYESLAVMTEGFSGSDLKNLCVAAAYQPIREILAKEKEEQESGNQIPSSDMNEFGSSREIVIRPLSLKDFEKSLKEISASVSEDAFSVAELRKWNEMFGEGGNRKRETLSYYL